MKKTAPNPMAAKKRYAPATDRSSDDAVAQQAADVEALAKSIQHRGRRPAHPQRAIEQAHAAGRTCWYP